MKVTFWGRVSPMYQLNIMRCLTQWFRFQNKIKYWWGTLIQTISCIIIKINIVRREVTSVWAKTKTLVCHLVLTTHAGYLPYVDPWIFESFLLIFESSNGASHEINENCSWWVLTRPLFHVFVWTTGGSSVSWSALADTCFFAQGDSNIRGPTLCALYTQVYLDQPDTLGATCLSGIS